ncbi:alpha-1,2-fucosyltransferase, partial [Helicobacter pylori]
IVKKKRKNTTASFL